MAHLVWAGEWLRYASRLRRRLEGREAAALGGSGGSGAQQLGSRPGSRAGGARPPPPPPPPPALTVPIFDARPLPPAGRQAVVRLPPEAQRAGRLQLHFQLDCPGRLDRVR
jgi:hypothetical protein